MSQTKINFEELKKNVSFAERYESKGSDSWIQEVDCLTPEDLDNIDPSMLKEAERRAYRLAAEYQIIQEARKDLFIYISLRYGYHCPQPDKVVYPHQAVVINDLMSLEKPNSLKSYSLTAPRGFVKTSTISDWLEWYLGRFPYMKSMIVGATERTSIKRLAAIKKNIMLDPLFKAVFPEIKADPNRPNNKTNLSLEVPYNLIDIRNSTIEAYGVSSSPEGGRADILFCDDICTYDNSIKEQKERESIKDKLKVTWWPLRTGPNMLRVWAYTPYHDLDASMEIYRKQNGWKKRFIKVSSDFTHLVDVTSGQKLPLPSQRWNPKIQKFEVWWNESELKNIWRNDPEEFRIAYWLETVSHESDTPNWESTWIWGDPSVDKEGAVQFGFGPAHDLYDCSIIAIGVDLAFGKSLASKNTAVVVVGMRDDGKRVVLDAKAGRGWGTARKVEEVKRMHEKWRSDIIVVEDNAAQSMLIDILNDKRTFDVRIKPFTTDLYKDAKLRVIANEFEDGWWIIPFESEHKHGRGQGCKCSKCLLIKELENYPLFDTSDVLMGMMFAKEGLKILGADKESATYTSINI